ncbi:TnsA endonuclease N-terminal domain-containing protein [Ferdinandcohnia quinoae]|uniref:TnsA endonuclease N-terminal domain-containing protein n=1 Tax=Fredinandcohnia quinoae TaxID=2918902 RepID=A0AAW5E500_9BACI|nr:TnsA endonuclease N-terminal domain-containing protein [Fredinandcohnia sp. SECRCQ15]MCH1627418.1 TnsA endonuclease N-terminal domain-containing protein [Fredinandcohnia sp. SECRCQ15]
MNGSRKIKASNKLSTRGKHRSTKMFRMIPWESTLERDFIKLLDFDQTVTYFEFQPVRIDYAYQGKERKYYPDFLVQKNDSKIYIYEVKAFAKRYDELNIIKFQVGKMYCMENNMKYVVVTEKDIRQGFLIDNLDVLTEIREESISGRVMNEILQKVNDLGGKTSIYELKRNLDHIDEAVLECSIYQLIYIHELYADLISNLINDELIVERN